MFFVRKLGSSKKKMISYSEIMNEDLIQIKTVKPFFGLEKSLFKA